MKKVFLFVFTIVLLGLAISAFLILNRPGRVLSEAEKQRALMNLLGRKPNFSGKQGPEGDVVYKGKYISFIYPANSTIYRITVNGQQVPDQGALEYFAFDTQNPRANIFTEVVQVNSSVLGVTDYPGVRLRQTQQNIYTQESVEAQGKKGLSFDKTDRTGYEKTAFFYFGGKIYSFSVHSSDSKGANEIYNKIILSLKFL